MVRPTAKATTTTACTPESCVVAKPTGAIDESDLADAVEWMRAWEVEYRIVVPERHRGAAEAGAWLDERGYARRVVDDPFSTPLPHRVRRRPQPFARD